MHNNRQKGLVEVLLLVGGITAIIFVGVFYLMTTKKNQATTPPVAQITDSSDFSGGETTAVTAAQLEAEFQAISLDDIDQDFTNIDADLSSL